MDWREKLGHPTTLVLYKTPEQWRHAIYGAGGNVLDGYLHLRVDAPMEEAQTELTRLASDIAQKPLLIEWTTDKPGWWTGEVTNAPGL